MVRERMNAAVLPYLNRQYPCWSNEGRVVFRAAGVTIAWKAMHLRLAAKRFL
jgi:hypothetical protein